MFAKTSWTATRTDIRPRPKFYSAVQLVEEQCFPWFPVIRPRCVNTVHQLKLMVNF